MKEGHSKYSKSEPPGRTVTIYLEGEAVEVPAESTVAAVLLGHDDEHFCRSAADRDERSPYCLMGVCFECLVEIDGIRDRQACLEPVVDGMRVGRQHDLDGETP